ncbi:hypothetical protein B0H16DRAFT_1658655 [Mycena metata]|uniref:RING-type domain-containing protein n=1 Tax=Mycena metata TaxID=1033252 RepID=A0AAD7K922_9AGAR|nr:hypothetical protein B0H16DRAFT_1658655 [Mycena metata]
MSSLSPIPEPEEVDPGPVKKYKKRAETRECPVCSEQIPVRLLQAHAELEAERVEAIIRRVGETDVDFESLESLEALAETPTRPRLSALRARKSLGAPTASSSSSKNLASTSSTPGTSALAATLQTITAIKRHRKQRHTKLKELVRSSEESFASTSSSRVRETWRRGASTAGEVTCPVCLANVRGDEDVIEAHVDACLVDQTRRLEEARQVALAQERERRQAQRRWRNGEDGDVDMDGAVGHIGDVRGTGFATRDPNSIDVDDEIDIDGDDDFGAPQFTEGDIVDDMDVDLEVDIDGEEEETLRELVAQGKVASLIINTPESQSTTPDDGEADKVDLAILAAKNRGDQASLLGLLQNKIKILESRSAATSLCRICIESYTDPTVSTGCWHTCCKECWLRCLGSTKLCPICKRITAATDLRRVYL